MARQSEGLGRRLASGVAEGQEARRRVLLLTVVSKPVAYHLGQTPEEHLDSPASAPRRSRTSGSFALLCGPELAATVLLIRLLPTVAGTAYDVSFWLENDDDLWKQSFWGFFWWCYSRTGGGSERLWVYAIYFYQCDTRSQR